MSIRLKQRGSHMTELQIDGLGEVLFSYETPVAARVKGRGYIRTEKFWSVTTSKHITIWLGSADAEKVPQEEIEGLLSWHNVKRQDIARLRNPAYDGPDGIFAFYGEDGS